MIAASIIRKAVPPADEDLERCTEEVQGTERVELISSAGVIVVRLQV